MQTDYEMQLKNSISTLALFSVFLALPMRKVCSLDLHKYRSTNNAGLLIIKKIQAKQSGSKKYRRKLNPSSKVLLPIHAGRFINVAQPAIKRSAGPL